jgi:hypothetical protein
MHRGASVVIAVVAILATGCGSGGSVTYEAHSRGQSMALCTACGSSQGNWSGFAILTARLKADSVLINVSARLGLRMLVVFCAPSVDGSSNHHVAVTKVGSPGEEGYPTSFSIDFPESLPQAHDYVCGFRIRRPKGVSRASYAHGALLALRLSRQ